MVSTECYYTQAPSVAECRQVSPHHKPSVYHQGRTAGFNLCGGLSHALCISHIRVTYGYTRPDGAVAK